MTAVALAQAEQVDCPDCDGQGVTTTPLFGRHIIADCLERSCRSCDTTGAVDADRVATCSVCTTRFWVGDGCDHRDEPRCSDCAARCGDCTTGRTER